MRRTRGGRVVAARWVGLLLALWVPPGATEAQTLDDLLAPPSPGFTILGLSPTAIERPTTPVALGLGLVSATERGTVIPESYAVEFTPYWLTPKPFLTFGERHDPSFWQGIKQSFAISVATDRGEEGDSTRLGIGARVQILSGRPSAQAQVVADSLGTLAVEITRVSERIDAAQGDTTGLRRQLAHLTDLVADLRAVSREEEGKRRGVRWELAGAFATAFPSQTFQDGDVTAWGLWSTLSLREWEDNLDLLFLLRYQELEAPSRAEGVEVAVESQQVLDVGARLIYGFGALSASAEVLGRTAFDISETADDALLVEYENSYRITASAEYSLSDRLAVQWTFGRGFEVAGADGGELISLLGLKWALGEGVPLF